MALNTFERIAQAGSGPRLRVKCNVQGLQELQAQLAAFTEGMRSKILVHAIATGAEVIRAEAALRAPYDPDSNPPHLRDTIVSVVRMTSSGNPVASIGPDASEFTMAKIRARGKRPARKSGDSKRSRRDANFYFLYQEFGTSKMEPHPYLRPAYDAKVDEAFQRMADDVAAVISSEGWRAGRFSFAAAA